MTQTYMLAVDIGNSNIALGAYCGNELAFTVALSSDRYKTADEYAMLIKNVFELHGVDISCVEGVCMASVVPQLQSVFKRALAAVIGVDPMCVGPGIKTGLNIRIENPASLAADFVASAVGAIAKYPLPVIIVDLGTATKIAVVDANRNFIGGSIAPGVMLSLDALTGHAALLPRISLDGDVKLIANGTADCMRSGVLLGAASMIDGMIARYSEALCETPTVVACGGLAETVIGHCREKIILDKNLLLDGLRELYHKNAV